MTEDSGLATTIATYVARASFEDIPPEVVTQAKFHLLDGLGSGIASAAMDYGVATHEGVLSIGMGDGATVLGFGTRMAPASAALVNGTLIHGLDFDDTHLAANFHATAPVLATALAAAEQREASGRDLLLAYIVASEVGCRLAEHMGGGLPDRGFHTTGIVGPFAAACAAGKLSGASEYELVNALGICGSQAAGILEFGGSWLKRLHPGWAAHSGIVALALSASGFRGPATVFEGARGVFATHLGHSEHANSLTDLGGRWMFSELALKPYPCCHFLHAFIDAAFEIRGTVDLDLTQIARIECPTSERAIPIVAEPISGKITPQATYDAMFSLQYTVALSLLKGHVQLADYYDSRLDDPDVLELSSKVECYPDVMSNFPAQFPGEVIVHLTDGRSIRSRIESGRGTVENPMTPEEITAKFSANASRVLDRNNVDRIADLVLGMETIERLDELVRLCCE